MTTPGDLRPGQVLTASRTITESDISRWSDLTGDRGAHHVAAMLGGRRIAQGHLTSVIAPLANNAGGVRMRSFRTRFLGPVFAGDTVTAVVRIVEAPGDPERDGVHYQVEIKNQDGVTVMTGIGSSVLGS